jgi:hypothetical protein
MLPRFVAYLVFAALMAISIACSAVLVVFLYLPMVAAKAACQALAGKVKLRAAGAAADQARDSGARPSREADTRA